MDQMDNRSKCSDKNPVVEDCLGEEEGARQAFIPVGGNRTVARTMVALLLTELHLASTYVTIAKCDSGEGKNVYRESALRVYEMVAHFLSGAALPQDQERKIKSNLADLKAGLQAKREIA
jgi:hypothetical protein